jgi:class 3 adenylate cyclase
VVNTAARIVGQAYPDSIVATQSIADHLAASEPENSCEIQPLGPHDLRGIKHRVELYRIRP